MGDSFEKWRSNELRRSESGDKIGKRRSLKLVQNSKKKEEVQHLGPTASVSSSNDTRNIKTKTEGKTVEPTKKKALKRHIDDSSTSNLPIKISKTNTASSKHKSNEFSGSDLRKKTVSSKSKTLEFHQLKDCGNKFKWKFKIVGRERRVEEVEIRIPV